MGGGFEGCGTDDGKEKETGGGERVETVREGITKTEVSVGSPGTRIVSVEKMMSPGIVNAPPGPLQVSPLSQQP
jgi:hypothetical protein